MRFRCHAWGELTSPEALNLLQRECARWQVELGWQLSRDWAAVDPARRAGLLAGWVVRDDVGRVAAWGFAADAPHLRQIGAIVTDGIDGTDDGRAAAAADALLDHIVDDTPSDILCFLRSAPGVTARTLARVGFEVQPHAYLVAPTTANAASSIPAGACAGGAPRLDEWRDTDLEATSDLLAAAYAADRSLRPFARSGAIDEWLDYVRGLTERPGCGVFAPPASVVLRVDGRVAGVALVTSVGPTTAHLGQLAVRPDVRGRGWSRVLVAEARARAARVLRASRLSLLVSDANAPARALYAASGFRAEGEFYAAFRAAAVRPSLGQPLRSINTAPSTGGASARL